MNKLVNIFSKIWFDLLILGGIFVGIYFLPKELLDNPSPKLGSIWVWMSKLLYVSSGFIHGHIFNQIFFPEIDFKREEGMTSNAVIVIVMYAVSVYCWSHGG